MLLLPFSLSVWHLVYCRESKVISQILRVINMNRAHQTVICWTVVFYSSLGPLPLVCMRAKEVEATNFLPFHGNGQNLTTVFILASSTFQITRDTNSLKLYILKPCLSLFYPLLDHMDDLLNLGKAPQAYWLWGMLGCVAWDIMSHLFKKKNVWSFSFRELLLPNKYLLTSIFWNNLWKS